MRGGDDSVLIGLSAVVIALQDWKPVVLTTSGADGAPGLPFGPFDPQTHRTFELALRAFVTEQTAFPLGFVEQLYTFGDAGRELPRAEMGAGGRRVVSVGYLALTPEAGALGGSGAGGGWSSILDFLPWEDRRGGPAPMIAQIIAPALEAWAAGDVARWTRADALFALTEGRRWNEERVLERYELLYEAGLAPEAARDRDGPAPEAPMGRAMASDHRRILATGLGRLRAKLKYRPVIFDLAPETFTLSELQAAAEAVSGLTLHKQNFRRGVERAGLAEPTGKQATATGGRPAALYRRAAADAFSGLATGLAMPAQR